MNAGEKDEDNPADGMLTARAARLRGHFEAATHHLLGRFAETVVEDAFLLTISDTANGVRRPCRVVAIRIRDWGFSSIYAADTELPHPDDLIGMTVHKVANCYSNVSIALLDALAASFLPVPAGIRSFTVDGDTECKSRFLSKLVLRHVSSSELRPSCIYSYGYFGYIELALAKLDVGYKFCDSTLGIPFASADLKSCQGAIISASALCEDSFYQAIDTCIDNNCPVTIVAQTAASLVHHILPLDMISIISQSFPYWYLPGRSIMNVREAV